MPVCPKLILKSPSTTLEEDVSVQGIRQTYQRLPMPQPHAVMFNQEHLLKYDLMLDG